MTESEKEEASITIKITKTDETVQKLETETQKIEEEASKAEQSTSSEASSKTTIQVKRIKHKHQRKRKNAIKNRIKRLKQIRTKTTSKITVNTKKIVTKTR
jgi:hypothetical protein